MGSAVVAYVFSCPEAYVFSCNLPGARSKPVSPSLAARFLTTGPPGKSRVLAKPRLFGSEVAVQLQGRTLKLQRCS